MKVVNPKGEDYLKLEDLVYVGNTGLGTGTMVEYIDKQTGKSYYFKYAMSRYSDKYLQPYKANKSECGYKIQRLVDEDTAVKCRTMTLNGHYGSIQEVLPHARNEYDLVAWQEGYISELPKSVIDDLMREFVTDYLLCNFDGHPKNFFTRADGKVVGVDKEQAFKYMDERGANIISYDYHPNEQYGEREPIYNTIFRRYAKGELDIDFKPVFEKIKKIQAIDNKEYREIFRKNVEMNPNQENTSEEFLDRIVHRKDTFLTKFTTFVAKLHQERSNYVKTEASNEYEL